MKDEDGMGGWSCLTPEMINAPDFAGVPKEGYIRLPGVLALIPVSRSTWYAGIASGKFPQPVKHFGTRVAAWNLRDIRDVIDGQYSGATRKIAGTDEGTRKKSITKMAIE